jgi:hypothetical protein
MSRMRYITIYLNSKYSYMWYPMDITYKDISCSCMPWRHIRPGITNSHISCLDARLNGEVNLTPLLQPRGNGPRYQLNKRVGGNDRQSGHFGNTNKSGLSRNRTSNCVSHNSIVAPTTSFRLLYCKNRPISTTVLLLGKHLMHKATIIGCIGCK